MWISSPDAVSSVPEGNAFRFGAVADFLVDALGGFNWETHRRESAVFDGAPNIGQMFWHFRCGDLRAGRGRDRRPEGVVREVDERQARLHPALVEDVDLAPRKLLLTPHRRHLPSS